MGTAGIVASPSLFSRWLLPIDHKDVGTLYLVFSIVAGLVGAALSFAIGFAPQAPGSPGVLAALASAHGLVMIFFLLMPALIGGFGNWFVPLLIGAPNTAFPRMNVLVFWLLVASFLLFVASFFIAGLSAVLSLFLSVISSVLGAINIVSTIVMMRRRGTGWAMPLFAWAMLITAAILLAALPVMAGAVTVMLAGPETGEPYGLFWYLGYPMIYVMILPAFGIVSQVVPAFSIRPASGQRIMVYAMAAMGLIGVVAWTQQLFDAPGSLPDFVVAASALVWLSIGAHLIVSMATIGGGLTSFGAPILWALGAMALFAIAGATGTLAVGFRLVGSLENSAGLMTHFHHLLALGSAFAVFAGFYYWLPRMTGYLYRQALARLHFCLLLAGVAIVFFSDGADFTVRIGAAIAAAGVVVFLATIIEALAAKRTAPANPWGSGPTTLEWTAA